eukprot:gb/GEZN01006878.1/.p1 GENE.gb/GEZN01006878.1/~~gb/GEZN01006878.1/.p1  ORF type:complete len:421 (-),score=69.43 gb/GEZN01006878.1/:345-1586(-)
MGEPSEKDASSTLYFEPVKATLNKYSAEIKALRAKIPEGLSMDEDLNLYRFLRGYNFDVEQTSVALNKCLQWRKDNKVDELRDFALKTEYCDLPDHEKIIKYAPANEMHGYDNKGQPIGLARIGLTNPSALMAALTLDQIIRLTICNCEKKLHLLNKLSYEKGVIIRAVRVTDLHGLGVMHMAKSTLDMYRGLISVVQANYPEMLGALYYVNVPWIFSSVFALVKPLLAPATLEKLKFCSGPADEELSKYMPKDVVPKFLGGQCQCGKCCPVLEEAAGLTKVVVARADKFQFTVEVPEPKVDAKESGDEAVSKQETETKQTQQVKEKKPKNTVLVEWIFQTVSNNIDFQLDFLPSKSDASVLVIPKARVESHIDPGISGHYAAEQAGTLTFTWDNTFSYLSSKTLLYRVDVGQ